jgi:hypothetical protein
MILYCAVATNRRRMLKAAIPFHCAHESGERTVRVGDRRWTCISSRRALSFDSRNLSLVNVTTATAHPLDSALIVNQGPNELCMKSNRQ